MNGKCRETENNGDGVVALTDNVGEVVRFYHVGTIEHKGEWYAFFKPVEELDGIDPDELLIYRIVERDQGEDLEPVLDDKVQAEVYERFIKEIEDDDDDGAPITTRGCCGGGDCPSQGDCSACTGCRK